MADWPASPYDHAIRYPYLLEQFRAQFDAGVWYPRWLSALYGGYGYPSFVFYPPGYFYFSLPFTTLASADVAAKYSNVACVALAASAYFTLARLWGNRLAVCLALTLLALCNAIWFRAAFDAVGLSQRFGFSFGLWCVAAFLRFTGDVRQGKPHGASLLALVACACAVAYTHVLISGMVAAVLAVMAVSEAAQMGQRRRLYGRLLGFAGLCVAVAAMPYWFTAWQMSDQISVWKAFADNPAYQFGRASSAGFVFWHMQLWLAGRGVTAALVYDVALYALVVAAVLFLWRRGRARGLAVLYAFALFALLPVSLPLWEGLISVLQMPQRMQYLAHLLEHVLL
ncbi:MAG: hypothetical protein K2Q01_01750, partial [Rickettsiales bacterium]|nr:hypothetical protein [Rickettsiales bacterium]